MPPIMRVILVTIILILWKMIQMVTNQIFSIENTEPTEVSQEETEEEIGARLARDRVDPGFSIDDDNIGNDFELADSSSSFTDGGTAYTHKTQNQTHLLNGL